MNRKDCVSLFRVSIASTVRSTLAPFLLFFNLLLLIYPHESFSNSCNSTATGEPTCTESTTSISDGQTVSGTLSNSSCADVYTFSGSAGQTVLTISMNKTGSSSLDPVLHLHDPAGNRIACDDDSGGNLNSLITNVTLPSSGTHKIEAKSYGNASTGSYQLFFDLNIVNPPPSISGSSVGVVPWGVHPTQIVCENKTTGQVVVVPTGSTNCGDAGLTVMPGDQIRIVLEGVATSPGAGIEFTYVPPYGSFNDLQGRVWRASPTDYAVAVYIKVGSGWWTKPYWSTPLTYIRPDGTWTCDITTGGTDQNATEIVAYLVPAGYSPPLMSGGSTLPAALDLNSVAKVQTTRAP